jgi:hypothetical protein
MKKAKPFPETMAATPEPSPKKKEGFEEYEIKGALDDLMRAEEHKANPKLMAAVHKHAHKKKKALSSISELRQKRQEMSEEKLPKEEELD